MGKKYIIELEDKPFHKGNGDFLYRVKGFNSLVFDMTGVGKLSPYTAPDIDKVKADAYNDGYKAGRNDGYKKCLKDMEQVRKEAYEAGMNSNAVKMADDKAHESYQKGLNDLWEAMQKAIKMYCEIDNEVFLRVFHDVKCDWGESVLQALFKNTPQHLIDSIRQYEQKQEEQIQVGDEVRFKNTGNKFVVTRIFASVEGHKCDKCEGLFDDGEVYESVLDVVEKTGRHFPEIAAVLEKMREKE